MKYIHIIIILCPYYICIVTSSISYLVWQKSNDTDFLLTMNVILFTNQGHPLQNSSLEQLHSDGGVVSIVRSSGYYLKYQNGALSSGF